MIQLANKMRLHVADPYVTSDDVMAVAKAVRTKHLSQGKFVQEFEKKFAKRIGVQHAAALCNGTAALHAALSAINVGANDEVIVPSFSFISTANAALYLGAKPVFVDIDPKTYNMDPSEIRKKITDKTRAIVVVHYAGQPADMDPINELAEHHDIFVVEDAAEAHGALYKGKIAGSLGDLACFSFYPNKNITTGEGGMVTTDNKALIEKIRMIRAHGQDRRYHHIMLGYNYRMTDIQAALGIVQLKRLNWVIRKKAEAAEYYNQKINEIFGEEIKPPYVAPFATHVYMFYSVRFKNKNTRDKVILSLKKKGIETTVAFPPIHLQPLYRGLFGYKVGFLPITEKVSETILSLPIYPHIRRKEQDYVISALEEALR
jgi:dTDP-4-amino-4,6-dideoxygalactose transaminase